MSCDRSFNVFGMQSIGWQRQWRRVFLVLRRGREAQQLPRKRYDRNHFRVPKCRHIAYINAVLQRSNVGNVPAFRQRRPAGCADPRKLTRLPLNTA
jgi:hypothetical protein